jgi:hypothetical protein
MRLKLSIWLCVALFAIVHAAISTTVLTHELHEYTSGERIDLADHGVRVMIADFPVVPLMLVLRPFGVTCCEDDVSQATVADGILIFSGSFYWALWGWVLGRALTQKFREAVAGRPRPFMRQGS